MVHIIVTGSRTLDEKARLAVNDVLEFARPEMQSLTHGGCKGADLMAAEFAENHGIKTHEFLPDWSIGKAAGPKRNRHMLRETVRRYKVDNIVLVAFTDKPLEQSRGTSNCVYEAGRLGIRTHHFTINSDGAYNKEF